LEWVIDGLTRKSVVHPICYAAWDEAVRRAKVDVSAS
jgi:hypothetical protein